MFRGNRRVSLCKNPLVHAVKPLVVVGFVVADIYVDYFIYISYLNYCQLGVSIRPSPQTYLFLLPALPRQKISIFFVDFHRFESRKTQDEFFGDLLLRVKFLVCDLSQKTSWET